MGRLTVIDGKKKCRKCKVTKLAKLFGKTRDDRYGKSYIDSSCKECRKIETYKWRKANPQRNKDISFRSKDKLKEIVLAAYGINGRALCVECGFSDIRALCIDHIFNNGAEERKSLGSKYFAGAIFHRWLRNNKFPAGYQTLCANCNLIKELIHRRYGNKSAL